LSAGETNVSRTVTTGANSHYNVPAVPPGTYSISAALAMTFAMLFVLGVDLQQVSIASPDHGARSSRRRSAVAGDAIKRDLALEHSTSCCARWLASWSFATCSGRSAPSPESHPARHDVVTVCEAQQAEGGAGPRLEASATLRAAEETRPRDVLNGTDAEEKGVARWHSASRPRAVPIPILLSGRLGINHVVAEEGELCREMYTRRSLKLYFGPTN
jgi:hypothetical protein